MPSNHNTFLSSFVKTVAPPPPISESLFPVGWLEHALKCQNLSKDSKEFVYPYPFSERPHFMVCGMLLTYSETASTDDTAVYECYFPKQEILCPHCKKKMQVKELCTVTLYHLPESGMKTCKLLIHFYRYRCAHCKFTITPPLPCQFLNFGITKDLALRILELTRHNETDRSVALSMMINERLVSKILDAWHILLEMDLGLEHMARELAKLSGTDEHDTLETLRIFQLSCIRNKIHAKVKEVMDSDECPFVPQEIIHSVFVDEVAIDGSDFYSLFINEKGEIIFFAKGRGKETVQKFVKWADGHLDPNLTVAADMHAPYLSAFEELMPSCILITDKFHLMEHLNEDTALTCKVRLSGLKKEKTKDELQEFAILKDPDFLTMLCKKQLNSNDQTILNEVGIKAPIVLRVRKVVELVHQAYNSRDRDQMEQLLNQVVVLCNSFQTDADASNKRKSKILESKANTINPPPSTKKQVLSLAIRPAEANVPEDKTKGLPLHPMVHFGQMVVKHLKYILNYAITGMTTGIIEGYNNLFKEIKHAKFGVKTLVRFMFRFKLIASWKHERHFTGKIHRIYAVQSQAESV